MGKLAAFWVSAILVFGDGYLWLFTGESSRGWFLYLVVIWPALSIYWLRELYRWALKKVETIPPAQAAS